MSRRKLLVPIVVLLGLCFVSLSVFAQNSNEIKDTKPSSEKTDQTDMNNNSESDLENSKWVLVKVGKKKLPKLPRAVTIQFNNEFGELTASGLCNMVRASYKKNAVKKSLEFRLKHSTLLGCEPENDVEVELSNALKNVNRYEISEDNLYLYKGKTSLVTLSKMKTNLYP